MDVDQKVQEIFRLRRLEEMVLLFRNSNEEIYGKNIKKTLKKDLQNLINADITLTQTKIKLPDLSTFPPLCPENLERVNLAQILTEEKITMEALEIMDME